MPAGLPLNVLTLIISHVRDLNDVLSLTRTSRLLYYLTLPKLYENVTLRSYSEVRRRDGRVEGLGGGSPFCMALSALATSQCSSVVKKLKVEGAWQESDEYMLGRIPDATVLLNIAVRAAIDKMVNLDSFIWDLDTKPLRQVYQGLSLRSTLSSFTLCFPNSRTPRPIAVMPPIPSLVALRVMNLDPLCYNDDISHCLLGSKNLRELKIHFSPRMRLEAECSSNLNTYFGKCIEAKYKMSIRSLGLQNFYGPNRGQLYQAMKQETMVDTHFLDVFGGAHGSRTNVFVDETWRRIPPELNFKWKLHRSNGFAMQHTRILRGFSGLEELYLTNKSLTATSPAASPNSTSSSDASTPGVLGGSADLANLTREYLDAILSQHGPTLRNLLLFEQFDFDAAELRDIIARCPKLEQLGLALSGNEDTFRNLIPSLPSGLRALRLLENRLFRRLGVTEEQNLDGVCREFGRQLFAAGNTRLRYIGLADKVFRVGGVKRVDSPRGNGEGMYELTAVTWDDVRHLGIWGMDNLQLF
ncbi:hypothetical protein K461DRAFT_219979 [Myriangium duriaei CBS 260.36]|uniref:F-box domain-containing protein n=1 Tax=Myriangium duriaei CBS 260.36 TaxID=1168546 RepID=A0A9P4JAV2_9PEZI|nr:hypothetical protein K461DRAFT_219979 [Myriangium duriaei CBS 260.36]